MERATRPPDADGDNNHESSRDRHLEKRCSRSQGKAIEGALGGLGFGDVGSVRQGKVFDVELTGSDKDAAKAELEQMCEKLLANTVIENYAIEIA
jgi:phosphoribosylformylglycinamidine synthase PurS subunit